MERAIAVETRRAAQLHVRVGAVDMGLLDAHFVAVINDADGAFVLKLDKLIVKRNFGNIHFYFDSVGLPKRAGNCEFAVYGAWTREVFEMQASGDEGIEIELRRAESSGDLLISGQSEVKLAGQFPRGHLGIDDEMSVFAVRYNFGVEVAFLIGANGESDEPNISLCNGRADGATAAHIELKLTGDGQG